MIGSVNSSRPVPAKRVPPRTRAKAAVVPMTVARIATTIATSTELSSAVWMALSASIASYQWVVSPVIGKPGRVRLLEREQDEERDRQIEEGQDRAGQDREDGSGQPGEYGLTGIVSSALIPLATGHHVLDPQGSPEDDEHDRHERRDDDRQRGSLGDLRLLGRSSRRGSRSDSPGLRRPASGVRNSPRIGMNTKMQAVMIPVRIWGTQDVPERLVGPRAEVLGRVELGEVELLEGRVEGQRREREVDVHEHDEDPEVVVDEQGRGLLDQADAHEELVERPGLAEDRLPGVDPEQVARPERDDDRQQDDALDAPADVPDEEVGEGQGQGEARRPSPRSPSPGS